jgi:hypothetical protein
MAMHAVVLVVQAQSALAAGLGEPDGGWHYKYPIHEVPDNQLTAYQGAPDATGLIGGTESSSAT